MAISRGEQILTSMINGTPYDQYPQSRLEDLLLQLKEVIEEGGGGTPAAENVTYDNTESGATAENVQDAIDEVFQSVSSGKTLIAGAITDKGVETSASDSFATMANNIEDIPSGPSYATLERAVVPKDQFANHYIWDIMTPYTSTGGRLYICAIACRDTAYPMVVKKNGSIIEGVSYYTHNGNTLGVWQIDTVENDVITFDNNPHWDVGYNHLLCAIIKSDIPSGGGSEVYKYTVGTYQGTVSKTTEIQHTGKLYCMMIDEMHNQVATLTVNGTNISPSIQNYYQGIGYDYFEADVSAGDTVVTTYYGNNSGSTRCVMLLTVEF